ncbi:protein containing DUF497 [Candidatus Magnetomorum sp. HK-1]|nr:protein containing DUF497 [Candidatus Magnetomorum sp. HK-1]
MRTQVNYYFEWDPQKAAINLKKHRVKFEKAATIFKDPRALTIFDDEHSQYEERWVTIGMDNSANLLVVVHTYHEIDQNVSKIRIISAQKAKENEISQYMEVL